MSRQLSSPASVVIKSLACLLPNIFSPLALPDPRLSANGQDRHCQLKCATKFGIFIVLLWSAVVLVSACFTARVVMADEPPLVQVPESVLRKLATKTVMPIYPETSKNQGVKGVAVAKLHANEKGVLTNIEILEAPNSEIGRAVINALQQWRFKAPYVEGKVIAFEGKLTFYFIISGGRARVENPRKFNLVRKETDEKRSN